MNNPIMTRWMLKYSEHGEVIFWGEVLWDKPLKKYMPKKLSKKSIIKVEWVQVDVVVAQSKEVNNE